MCLCDVIIINYDKKEKKFTIILNFDFFVLRFFLKKRKGACHLKKRKKQPVLINDKPITYIIFRHISDI